MDTSKEYLEMCKNAKEIQDLWKPRFSDFVYHFVNYLEEIGIIVSCPKEKDLLIIYVNDRVKYIYQLDTLCWIPRQDQLQELLWNTNILEDNVTHLLIRFYDTIHGTDPEDRDFYWTQFNTFEQLWLTFYMWSKHYKIWDGNKWIQL